MSNKICKKCGASVDSKGVCPQCGKDQRNFFVKHKVLSVIAVVILLAVVITASKGGNSSNQNQIASTGNGQSSPTGTTPTEELLEVDYNVLFQDYQDNAIAADGKYKGKMLKLTGPVENIDREIAGNPYVTFHIGDEYSFQSVRLTFKKSQESKVSELQKGQTITIKGKCTGLLLSTSVALTDCEIID